MYNRGVSGSGAPRETDSLLIGDTANASGGLTSYNDKNGGEYVFAKAGGVLAPPKGTPHPCSVCCSVFSFIGIIYLVILGTYASLGWNYFPHIWPEEKKGTVALNAFCAAGLYVGCFVLSLYYWSKTAKESLYTRGTVGRVGAMSEDYGDFHTTEPEFGAGVGSSFRDLDDKF
eukprot:CAMPEP_0203771026 /NCGR_PEP_ID=MMETSP0099_2-20121227/3172_1 /ASSEMBLY_ACC=CAM_ASM_000209 /TAXON_ID=96639 /ORGANISM=" , Strain NY0313808BC1" /LENGTH=172 /DNA_ID=CAMNT_0050668297 /DNA_START=473 /DNA_END=989 /DNA_ORIENTATION=-